jgi:lysosomal alpha-mannosidase
MPPLDNTGFKDNSVINVHIVPHSHDDVGWVKTVDQYYSGTNSSIEEASVQFILDTVVEELWRDDSRRFIYVEMFYFERWWREQDESTRGRVRTLVKEGRLEFANGGWSMNDEGCTHYTDIIDQMSLGLRFITREFGPEARPHVAWHIDPFGHSSGQATLFAQMGFQGYFVYRIDYQDELRRTYLTTPPTTEMVWRGSPFNLGPQTDIFTGVLYGKYNYHNPPGFCFDYTRCTDKEHPDPVVDDETQFTYNLEEKLKLFADIAKDQAKHYRTNNIMLTMGQDFTYSNARTWFKSLDKIIQHINQNDSFGVRAFYSTPTEYMMSKHKANLTWDLKVDDFMPYSDAPGGYWTGYYTSRPALKGYIRTLSSFLQVCRQYEVWVGGMLGWVGSGVLARMMGVAQHHDAITGTEKQHVADDYAMRLHLGQVSCENVIASGLNILTSRHGHIESSKTWKFCEYLNISICSESESGSFNVVIYNPLASNRTVFVDVPVNSTASVYDSYGGHVDSTLYPVSNATQAVRKYRGSSKYTLRFTAPSIPPLGFAMYFVRPSSTQGGNSTERIDQYIPETTKMENFVIKNEHIALVFNGTTGRVMTFTNLDSNATISLDQQFLSYNSYASGPYVFLPYHDAPTPENDGNVAKYEILGGQSPTEVQEVRQVYSDHVSQAIRLYPGEKFVEFEYTLGPILLNSEYITRFDTDLQSNATWWTDTNGREMRKRVRNHRESWRLNVTQNVSGNYYPVVNRMFIRDESKGVQLTVLTDRSHGGSSLRDGSMELMIHRRLETDDNRGITEVLDEPGQFGEGLIVRGRQWVVLETIDKSASVHRVLSQQLLHRPTLSFSEDSTDPHLLVQNYTTLYSAVTRGLPPNVHLLTLQLLDRRSLLLRLEHQFEKEEDSELSQPVTVDLSDFFHPFKILSLVELGLAGNVPVSDISSGRLQWKTNALHPNVRSLDVLKDRFTNGTVITLKPMDIRTFNVTVSFP